MGSDKNHVGQAMRQHCYGVVEVLLAWDRERSKVKDFRQDWCEV